MKKSIVSLRLMRNNRTEHNKGSALFGFCFEIYDDVKLLPISIYLFRRL